MISTSNQKVFANSRRSFLRGALSTSALLMATRPSSSVIAFAQERRFAPVKVSPNRIIREVVGLRPFRAPGFVVVAERMGRKLLVHNYGHGGAGVTLSWGTASLAVDLIRDFIQSSPRPNVRRRINAGRFGVIGCGVSGLSTALLLQRRYQDGPGTVTIYAKDLPPETTSNIAGAHWSPTLVYEPQRATSLFTDQFAAACKTSHRAFQNLVSNEYGVRWIETLELLRHEASLGREMPGGADLYPNTVVHRDPERYFGFPFVRHFNTMLIEPAVYLRALLRDFYVAGGKLIVKDFRSREEIARLPETIVFNCTGLGARALFDDQELVPVRGQLVVLLPQPEIDYCYLGGGYMFPRRDGIILGGTWDHDDWSLTPNPEQTTEIIETHAQIMQAS
jgi:glycine/D-amino acid oxidase-like deaminating enzyme